MAYYELEPWGENRADLRSGEVAATVANAWMKKPGGGVFSPRDFMHYLDARPEEDDPRARMEALKAVVVTANAALGGRDLRQQK